MIGMSGSKSPHALHRDVCLCLLVALGLALALLDAPSAWAYPALIGRANIDGSNPDYSFIPADAPWLAADDEHLYWANFDPSAHTFDAGSSIGRANLDGTGVDPTFIDQPRGSVYGLAVNAAHIYWVRFTQGDATIARANLNGTGVDPTFITDIGGIVAGGLAVDSSHIFWGHNFWIGRANLDGSGVDPEFISEYNRFFDINGGVAVRGGHVYWSNEASQGEKTWIGRANVNGTGIDPTFIDPEFGSGAAIKLAADSRHLYWESYRGITRANLDGSGAEMLVPGGGPSMAVNSSHIYWGRAAAQPAFIVHKPERHRRRGTATLPVDVLAGPGELVLTGKGLRTVTRTIEFRSARELLRVKPKGRKRHRLRRRGHVRVTAELTLTLTGGDPRTQTKSFRLVER
jgi:hypothetical protein